MYPDSFLIPDSRNPPPAIAQALLAPLKRGTIILAHYLLFFKNNKYHMNKDSSQYSLLYTLKFSSD